MLGDYIALRASRINQPSIGFNDIKYIQTRESVKTLKCRPENDECSVIRHPAAKP